MNNTQFRQLAVSFNQVEEKQHFHRIAFKITGKIIFATLDEESSSANLKLSTIDQSVFSLADKENIYPIKNKWGLQGWTTFEIVNIDAELMRDALATAYEEAGKGKRKKKSY